MTKKILLTGFPGCGKSTLVKKVIGKLEKPATGFITQEIRDHGRRVGFSIRTLDGKEGILASVKIKSKFKVGKYGVCIDDLENIAVPSMTPDSRDTLVVIDEIGKMECFSSLFKKRLLEILDTHPLVLATIAKKGDSFMEKIKRREDLRLVEVTPNNRDSLVDIICNEFSNKNS